MLSAVPRMVKIMPMTNARMVRAGSEQGTGTLVNGVLTRHVGIVNVGYGSSHFGIRAVLLCHVKVDDGFFANLAVLCHPAHSISPSGLTVGNSHVARQLGHAIAASTHSTSCSGPSLAGEGSLAICSRDERLRRAHPTSGIGRSSSGPLTTGIRTSLGHGFRLERRS